MSDDTPVVVLLEAGAAAGMLGVSASGLRRLSIIYEEVYEELPRKPKSNNRLWPKNAIERLQTARVLVQEERYRTIQEALEAVKHGLVDEGELEDTRAPPMPSQYSLNVLIDELKGLREELVVTRKQNQALQIQLSKRLEVSSEETLAVRLAQQFDRLLARFRKR